MKLRRRAVDSSARRRRRDRIRLRAQRPALSTRGDSRLRGRPVARRPQALAVARRRVAGRRRSSSASTVRQLPLDDASVDAALSTFTLCTIPDVDRALQRGASGAASPGGTFHFLEHGLCPDPAVAQRQHRFNGVQQRRLRRLPPRPPDRALMREAGFEITQLEHDQMRGPEVHAARGATCTRAWRRGRRHA